MKEEWWCEQWLKPKKKETPPPVVVESPPPPPKPIKTWVEPPTAQIPTRADFIRRMRK